MNTHIYLVWETSHGPLHISQYLVGIFASEASAISKTKELNDTNQNPVASREVGPFSGVIYAYYPVELSP